MNFHLLKRPFKELPDMELRLQYMMFLGKFVEIASKDPEVGEDFAKLALLNEEMTIRYVESAMKENFEKGIKTVEEVLERNKIK